jgi:hypothetical protein
MPFCQKEGLSICCWFAYIVVDWTQIQRQRNMTFLLQGHLITVTLIRTIISLIKQQQELHQEHLRWKWEIEAKLENFS